MTPATLYVAAPLPREIAEIRVDADMWQVALAFARPASREEATTATGLPASVVDEVSDRLTRLGLLVEADAPVESAGREDEAPSDGAPLIDWSSDRDPGATDAPGETGIADPAATDAAADASDETDQTAAALRHLIDGVKKL